MFVRRRVLGLALGWLVMGSGATAVAGQPATPPRPTEPTPPLSEPPPPAPVAEAAPAAEAMSDPLADALRPSATGLHPDQVAARASATSPAVAARAAEVRAAEARLDQALVAYFPTLGTFASYTRLSPVENTLDSGIPGVPPVEIQTRLDSFQLGASLTVPLSDYLLRLTQAYASAARSADAKRLEARAETLASAADARSAYYEWLRFRGRRAVAELAVAQAGHHLEDARARLAARAGTQADVLRFEAQLAAARQLWAAAGSAERASVEQLRTLMHEPTHSTAAVFEPGVDVLGPPPPAERRPVAALIELAWKRRLELAGLAAAREALAKAERVARAGYWPRLDGVANLLYANPNPRFFSQEGRFDATWDVGVRLSWRVNDTFTTIGAAAEARARVDAVSEQAAALRDGIRIAVVAAHELGLRAESAIAAARVRERAATEVLRVRRELFQAGKATATDIVDAETELVRSRLERVDAHVDAHLARVRLAHATGDR
jgi:outer membrane protein TolC